MKRGFEELKQPTKMRKNDNNRESIIVDKENGRVTRTF